MKGQKNDYNDAEAIAEAALRPNLRVVQEKSQDQLDLQACRLGLKDAFEKLPQCIVGMEACLSAHFVSRVLRVVISFAQEDRGRDHSRSRKGLAMSGVVVRGLSKSYGAVHALNAIDMEVETGDFAVLLGLSGCGKSTLLNAIAGLDAGSVEIGLRVTAPLPLHAENTLDEGQLTRSFGVRVLELIATVHQ